MPQRPKISLIGRLLVLPIRVYQRLVSPLLPDACRYYPTCSEYTAQAIINLGLSKGLLLGAWRLGRCSPWFCGGVDFPPIYLPWKLVGPYLKRTTIRHRS